MLNFQRQINGFQSSIQKRTLYSVTGWGKLGVKPKTLNRNQPNYMRSKPHLQALREAIDDDGVPLHPADYTPIGNKNRPKRQKVEQFHAVATQMKKYNTLERASERADREPKKVVAPKYVREVPVARKGMTVELFLKRIGRMNDKYTDKFTSWEHFWSHDGRMLKKAGVDLRDRKYILNWMSKYRNGMEPFFVRLPSKAKKNAELEWRLALITQKEKRIELGLD